MFEFFGNLGVSAIFGGNSHPEIGTTEHTSVNLDGLQPAEIAVLQAEMAKGRSAESVMREMHPDRAHQVKTWTTKD